MALSGLYLVVFKGLMGVGKSALSRALGKKLAWPVVDKDDFSDVLMNRVERYGPLAYDAMFSVSRSLLQQGFSIIVDSPLRGQVGYFNAKRVADEAGAELRVIACACSNKAIWKARLETRTRRPAHVLKTWADLERYRETALTDFDYEIDAPMLEIDTINPLNEIVDEATAWLARQPKRKDFHA